MPIPSLRELLKRMAVSHGSDLHITTNSPPRIRVHGELKPCEDLPALGPAETKQLCYSILTDAQKHRFEENLELDFSFGIKNVARFRGNLFHQRGAVAGVFRVIPFEIKTFEQLGLPPDPAQAVRETARADPGDGAYGQRQIDHPGDDARPDQLHPERTHDHH